MLKHENRIVVADRGLQHQIGLFGIGGTDDLDPRHRQEPGLGGLRVLGAESQAGSAESPNDDRRLDAPARHEAVLGDAVGDLIEADPEEVGEHNLDDGPVAGQRETQRRADEAGLRDRRIADALRAKLFIETVACLEGAAGLANILAHDQGLRIAPHLLAQRRDNRLAVGDLLGDPFNRLDPGRNDFLIRPRHKVLRLRGPWRSSGAVSGRFDERAGLSGHVFCANVRHEAGGAEIGPVERDRI